jgi:hypothetical protein
MRLTRTVRALLPFAVTAGIFYAISQRIDWLDVFTHIRANTLLILGPALIIWATVSLCVDALSLLCCSAEPRGASFAGMARMKAATYPLGILHYALGVGALVLLLRRRAGRSLSDATGTVVLIAGMDLLTLLALVAAAAALAVGTVGVRIGVLAIALVGTPLGLLLLRTRSNLGALEPVRQLGVLRAAREIPTPQLVQLMALRLLFVCVFLALGGAAFASFGLYPQLGTLVVGLGQVALVAALPIAVAGLGTSQAAFLYVFRSLAPPEELLACSVALSAGMIAVRVGLGALFAREFALPAVAQEEDAGT